MECVNEVVQPTNHQPSKVRTNYKNFYRLCQTMQAEKDKLILSRPTLEDASKFFEEKLGFPIGQHTIIRAQQVTEVKWKPHKENTKPRQYKPIQVGNATHILAGALLDVFTHLGMIAPQELIDISQAPIMKKKPKEETPTV